MQQIITKNPWCTIYREQSGGALRLVAKYTDYTDSNIYTMYIVEVAGGRLSIYTKWNLPERQGERLVYSTYLSEEEEEQWRRRVEGVRTVEEFKRLTWELDEMLIRMNIY